MPISSRAWLLVLAFALISTIARSDGIGPFSTGQSIYGGISAISGAATVPPTSGALMLEDGASFLLLEDGTSNLCLEGGC